MGFIVSNDEMRVVMLTPVKLGRFKVAAELAGLMSGHIMSSYVYKNILSHVRQVIVWIDSLKMR